MRFSYFYLATLCVVLFSSINISAAQTLDATRLSFFSVDPGVRWWPLMMSAQYNDSSVDASQIIFTWSFPGEADQSCTYRGVPGVMPCRGIVVEKTWLHTRLVSVVLTASLQGRPSITFSKQFNIQASYTGPVARRENVLTMATDRWLAFRNACLRLKAIGIWDHMVYHHLAAASTGVRMGSNRNAAHRGPAFLPWHRVYLRVLERAIQAISGDNTLGIPYWDWTVDSALPGGPKTSRLWTDDFIGGDGDPANDYRVMTGPFCSVMSSTCAGQWPLLNQLNGPYLERQLGNLSQALPGATQIANVMTVRIFDSGTLDDRVTASTSFRNALEGWNGGSRYGGAHNLVHMFVGGSMNPSTSPNDPVFFLHHANVDRLWHNWQVSTGCYADCYVPHTGDGSVSASTNAAKMVNGQYRLPGHEWESRLYPWFLHPYDVGDQDNSVLSYEWVQ